MQLPGDLFDSSIINLRGHHLLCIHTFAGMGYSEAFVDTMERIAGARKSPSQRVRIVEGPDDICASCPHRDGASCLRDEANIESMDRALLSALSVGVGEIHPFLSLHQKIEEGVQKRLFNGVCAGCSWFTPVCNRTLCPNVPATPKFAASTVEGDRQF